MTDVYRTYSDEDGQMFVRQPIFKGQRPVSEDDVDYMTSLSKSSHEAEAARALRWLAQYRECRDRREL